MENMNNIPETSELSPSKKSFDKTSWAILIISLALSIVFFVIGFSSLGSKKLELYEVKTDSVEAYEYEAYEFTPENGGYYVLYMEGASLSYCEDEDEDSISYSSLPSYEISSSYDYGYVVYIPRGTTCVFNIYTQESEITLYLDRYNGN